METIIDRNTSIEHDGSHLVIEQSHLGWPRSGYKKSFTKMKVRNVGDSVQIEIVIDELKDNDRLYSKHGSLVLDLEQVKLLIKALNS